MDNTQRFNHYVNSLSVSINIDQESIAYHSPILLTVDVLKNISVNDYGNQKETIKFLVSIIHKFFELYEHCAQVGKNKILIETMSQIAASL